jgi:hypothetical protein
LCPPLIITEAQIADLMGRIKFALDDAFKRVEGGMLSPQAAFASGGRRLDPF